MSKIDERSLIEQEIALLKAKRSDDRKMIQQNFLELMDELNPIKKIHKSLNATIDHLFDRLDCLKPLISKIKNLLN